MVVRVYEKCKQITDRIINVRLENTDDGVYMIAGDENGGGVEYYICKLTHDGLKLCEQVKMNGMTVDKNGYVKVGKE